MTKENSILCLLKTYITYKFTNTRIQLSYATWGGNSPQAIGYLTRTPTPDMENFS